MLLGAGVVAVMLAFQGVAALPVVVAQFVVNGAMFLFSFQALPGGWSLPVPEMEALMVVMVSAEARLRCPRLKNYGRMVVEVGTRVAPCPPHRFRRAVWPAPGSSRERACLVLQ
jgi:hypothetical protein